MLSAARAIVEEKLDEGDTAHLLLVMDELRGNTSPVKYELASLKAINDGNMQIKAAIVQNIANQIYYDVEFLKKPQDNTKAWSEDSEKRKLISDAGNAARDKLIRWAKARTNEIKKAILGETRSAVEQELNDFKRRHDPNLFGDIHGDEGKMRMKSFIANKVFRNLEGNLRILGEIVGVNSDVFDDSKVKPKSLK